MGIQENSVQFGCVGAGKMGLPIAWNIARKMQQPLHIYDPGLVKLPPEVQADAARLNLVAQIEALSTCTVVVLCLPDSTAVSAVVQGEGTGPGLIDILAPGSVILDCGSSMPAQTRRLYAQLIARQVRLHDVPVSGGVARAWKGELTAMTGGLATDSPLIPIIASFASKIVHLDRVGDGHVMKTANNYLMAANMISFTEALRFARASGISFEKFDEVINHSSGASYVSANKMELVRRDDNTVHFTAALIAKDVRNFTQSCHNETLDLPLAPQVLAIWAAALEELGSETDAMKIFHILGRYPHARFTTSEINKAVV